VIIENNGELLWINTHGDYNKRQGGDNNPLADL